jgi:hypothetical protein
MNKLSNLEVKEEAFDQWKAIYAFKLEPGHKMRDAAGGAIEITGVYPSADEHVYVMTKDRLGMHIPTREIVLILPNGKDHP